MGWSDVPMMAPPLVRVNDEVHVNDTRRPDFFARGPGFDHLSYGSDRTTVLKCTLTGV
jgi:hypothetical protein